RVLNSVNISVVNVAQGKHLRLQQSPEVATPISAYVAMIGPGFGYSGQTALDLPLPKPASPLSTPISPSPNRSLIPQDSATPPQEPKNPKTRAQWLRRIFISL